MLRENYRSGHKRKEKEGKTKATIIDDIKKEAHTRE